MSLADYDDDKPSWTFILVMGVLLVVLVFGLSWALRDSGGRIREAYRQGVEAAVEGIPPDACPYIGHRDSFFGEDTSKREAWLKGWNVGYREKVNKK